MTDKKKSKLEEEGQFERSRGRLKNPSPTGAQQNPVSNPGNSTVMEEEIEEKKKLRKEQEKEGGGDAS